MAPILNIFVGFETGGLEEASATSGSPDPTEEVIVRSGTRSLKMSDLSYQYDIPWVRGGVTDAGNDYIVGLGFNGVGPGGIFLRCNDSGGLVWQLIVDNNSALLLRDAEDDEIGSSENGTIVNGTWYFIEVHFQHSGTANIEVFVNGLSVIGPLSGENLTQSGTIDSIQLLGATVGAFYFDDVYILSGAASAADRYGDCEVYKYQSTKASATPDTGSDLDAGDWDECGQTPLSTTTPNAEYTDTGAGSVDSNDTDGSPEGPKNDLRIIGDSNIKAILGISNMQRSGGGGTLHYILLGNTGDGTTRSADLDPTQSFDNYFFLSELASIVPLSTEYCSIGFEMTNAQDYECQEQWAMLLHVPSADVTDLADAEWPDQNYFAGPFQI